MTQIDGDTLLLPKSLSPPEDLVRVDCRLSLDDAQASSTTCNRSTIN